MAHLKAEQPSAVKGPVRQLALPQKRGLGWPWDNTPSEFSMYQSGIAKHKISWVFNWEMWQPPGLPSGAEYVPQVRLGSEASDIDKSMSAIPKTKHFIGFNEPEMKSESNMSVSTAVALWKQYVEPVKKKYGYALGSPAMTSDPRGKQWLQEFFKELHGSSSVDFVVVHWYGTDVKDLEKFLVDQHTTFGKPIWLTEFAYSHLNTSVPAPTVAQVVAFMKEALKFLDTCPFVSRYAYFGAKTDVGPLVGEANNFSKNGTLTEVGRLYLSF